MSDDGGMQWWAEVGQYDAERRMEEMTQALEDYRKWRKAFDSGLPITNVKNSDNVKEI